MLKHNVGEIEEVTTMPTITLRKKLLIPLVAILLVSTGSVEATWYKERIANGSDIIMMDLRWPWWCSGTYYANWNTSFNPKPNNITFYAGFLAYAADGPDFRPNTDDKVQDSFRPGSVWSFWGSDKQGTPVRFTDVAPNLYIKNDYGGEGSSGTMGAEVWRFMQRKRWYTMLARVWQPAGGDGHSYVGRWIKDNADGRWHLIGIARLPIAATSFTSNSGFIETLSNARVVRPLHRRLGYCRKDGKWLKADTIGINKTAYVVVNAIPEGAHEYAAIEYSNKTDLLPLKLEGRPLAIDKVHEFKVKQPDLPILDKPKVMNVRAETTRRQVAVTWDIPDTASPAFSYRIEVFDNRQCRGEPKMVKEEHMPTVRHALIDVALRSPTIRLTVTDIFDQAAPAVIVSATASKAQAPAKKSGATVTGLAYELFHKDSQRKINYFNPPLQKPNESHHWLTLSELDQGKLFRSGLARGFDLSVRERRNTGYAIVFKGLLCVPADGLYIFRAQIDGAYRIRIGGEDVLVWDGQHGTTEKAAVRNFTKGDHALEVTYLYDRLAARNFGITWEGPRLPRQPIPLDALRISDTDTYPTLKLKTNAPGDGTGHIAVTVDARGHQVNKTALFLGKLQLRESSGPTLTYDGPLPRGANSLWCRVVYDKSHSVDSNPITLDVAGKAIAAEWTRRNVSDRNASAGLWQTGANAFRFFGNGMQTVTKRTTGDFTATCRIDAYNGSKGEPVNRRAWVGLTAREHGERLNWNWGRDFHVVQTAADGLRASADSSDLGGSRISSYRLPKGRPWIRIVRQGQVWTAWTSTDGKQWELGAYQFKKTRPQMDVGLFFSALPQNARAHYHASVSNLSIVPGALAESTPTAPAAAKTTAGDRLTGVVVARSDAQVVVLRSSSKGLIRSTNGGKTWSPANGKLRGDDLAVRSVAIHPTDSLTMLRACGRGADGRLWRTKDGGKTWTKLNLVGDFDGSGPSALCGEVIVFDLRTPKTIYVGCESKGFFKSTDAGSTWSNLGLTGERITAVRDWRWEKFYPDLARKMTHLCVTTSPDQWMSFLGRGKPSVVVKETRSRIYVSAKNVGSLRLLEQRTDTGFYNVAWDKSLQANNVMSFATTHGYQGNSGGHMSLFPSQKNLEWLRPITALGTTAVGARRDGRFFTQALDPIMPGRLSFCESGWGMGWKWRKVKGTPPKGGLIHADGDPHQGEHWWFVCTDGLYFSPDAGKTLNKVMSESGPQ